MDHTLYMKRALELAHLGLGHVRPNPLVGCVIVADDQIIGEGYHRYYGQAHAEVNAINAVSDKSRLQSATVYVTLEPCAHFGKTPPCADLLIKHQVRKVIICNTDPNPLVAGKGIQKLRDAGIEVETGLLEAEGRQLNRRFFTSMEQQRPFVLLKWAQTGDGFIARANYDSKWISNPYSRQLVHKWRAEEAAILVGTATALHDDPSLTVRDWSGPNPLRVVVDRHLRLPASLHLLDGSCPTLCITEAQNASAPNLEFVTVESITPASILAELHQRGLQSVLVEGGAQLLSAFIEADLWDEARIFTTPLTFGDGIAAPTLKGELLEEQQVLTDKLQRFKPIN